MEDKDKVREEHKIDWQVWIPIILWIGCVFLGILKVLLEPMYNPNATIGVEEILNTINGNTFSTFISVVVCMLYQHFSSLKEGAKRNEGSGLSMRNMPVTIIITVLYLMGACFDAAISKIAMTIIYTVINAAYVGCFFGVFLDKKKK